MAKEHYRTSAVALDNSVIAVIPDRIIRKLVRESTNVAMFFIRHLATLLGTSDERIINHTQKHIRGRLADTLISLKEKYGVEHDGMTLGVNISREDLAGMSNMTTSNAIRTLSSFANEADNLDTKKENNHQRRRRAEKHLHLRLTARRSGDDKVDHLLFHRD